MLVPSYAELLQQGTRGDLAGRKGGGYGLLLLRPSERTWLPFRHRRYVRTTNLVERSFEEERRRRKVIPCFLTEKSALKLVFSVLMRAAKRWRRISFTKIELNYLDRLREELGIKEEPQDMQELEEVCN